MSRWASSLAALSIFAFSILSSCTSTVNPDENSNANANDNGSANDNGTANDNSSSDDVTLTIQFDAPGVGSARVVGFVNQGNVLRADAESTITPWAFNTSFDPGGSNGASYVYPRGTQICLVCSESETVISPTNTGVSPTPTTTAGQFVDWQGDFQAADVGSDAGILFFTLNENRTITAHFELMHGVVIRSQGGAAGTGTSVDIEFLEQTPFTIPPLQFGNSTGVNFVGTGLTGQQGQIGKFYFARDGTMIKFTVPSPSPFTSWSGDGAISGREVTFTFGQRTQIVDLDWP